MKRIKVFLKIVVGFILFVILSIFALGLYLESHKLELIEKVEQWYSENHSGILKFDDVSVNTFRNFPSVAFVATNISLSDTTAVNNEVLKISEIHLLVSFQQLLQKQIQFKSLKIKGGALHLIKHQDGRNNHHVFKATHKDTVQKKDFKQFFSDEHFKFSVQDFGLSMSDFVKNEEIQSTINEVEVSIKVFEKNIRVTKVLIDQGSIDIVKKDTDEFGNKIFVQTKIDSIEKQKFSNTLFDAHSFFTIQNFDISYKDLLKNKRITGYINAIKTTAEFEKDGLKAAVDLNVKMDELGLNLANGTFFNGALVKGAAQVSVSFKKDEITIPQFDLSVGNQLFKVSGVINTIGAGTFNFKLENAATEARATIALLSQNIQEKLKTYQMVHPFYTLTHLKGSFAYKSNPLVKIRAESSKNIAKIDEIELNDLAFKGDFVNRVYDLTGELEENKKNLKLSFQNVSGTYRAIPFVISNSTYTSTPKVLNYYDIQLKSTGTTLKLNELFHNDTFIFSKGNFNLETTYKGNAENLDAVFRGTNTYLTLDKSEVVYSPLSISIPIDHLKFEVLKKDAYLESLVIPLGDSGNYLNFSGDIKNATSLVFDHNEKVISEVQLTSKNLRWKDFIELFRELKSSGDEKQKGEKKLLNQVLKGIYQKFNPKLEILIDKCRYNSFEASNLETSFYFEGEDQLYFEKTGFNFNGKDISMNIFLDISDNDETLFDLTFDTEDLDFGLFLKEFNYFELSSFKEIERLSGNITLDVELQGKMDYVVGLDTKSLKGKAFFELNDVEVFGFKPLEKVANKVFRKERFEDIKFAPITNTIFIADRTIEIPQMQVQSTAFDLFVEGHLNYDHKTNIWVSIPLSNLKRRDIEHIPAVEDYAATGKKVFVEVKENSKGDLEYKLHLNNKKLYEEQGNLSQYKSSHKNERKEHKAFKKNERQKKREQRRN